MARFLLTLWPYPTHVRPFMAVAQALRRRGHEVAAYTGGDGAAAFKAEGFRVYPFVRTSWPGVQTAVERLIADRRRIRKLGSLWKAFLIDTVPAQVEDVDEILADWEADVILCDLAMCGPYLATRERNGIPVAMLSHVAYCLLPGPRGPVPGSVLPRDGGPMTTLLAWAIAATVSRVVGATAQGARELRRRYGLPNVGKAVTELSGEADLYLQPSAPDFDYFRDDLPSNVHYVGACLWSGPSADQRPAWIDSIPRERPWVLVEEGALHTNEAPLLEAAARLTGLPCEIIILRGEGRRPSELPLSAAGVGIRVHDWVALAHILPLVDVMVTNANSDSVLFALDAGCPIVAVPSIWDQMETARQIESAGAGVRLPLAHCTPRSLRTTVARVLATPSFRADAKRIGHALRALGGANRAAELLDRLIQRRG